MVHISEDYYIVFLYNLVFFRYFVPTVNINYQFYYQFYFIYLFNLLIKNYFRIMQLDEFRKGGFSGSSENLMSGSGESEVTKTSEFINRINTGEREKILE